MRKLLLIAFAVGAALFIGVAPATARPLSSDDDQSEQAGKKKRDGGTRDEEREED